MLNVRWAMIHSYCGKPSKAYQIQTIIQTVHAYSFHIKNPLSKRNYNKSAFFFPPSHQSGQTAAEAAKNSLSIMYGSRRLLVLFNLFVVYCYMSCFASIPHFAEGLGYSLGIL